METPNLILTFLGTLATVALLKQAAVRQTLKVRLHKEEITKDHLGIPKSKMVKDRVLVGDSLEVARDKAKDLIKNPAEEKQT
jgi:hypothetical protein